MLTESNKNVLRYGGLAGVAGGVLMIAVFALVIILVGPEPAGLEGPISRAPDIKALRTVENVLYLASLVLWAMPYLALHRALRDTSPAASLFGSALGLLGLGVIAAGAIPHLVTSPLSDLYHAADATADSRTSLALIWHANQDLFEALLLTGMLITTAGTVLLGAAMFRNPLLGTKFGITGVATGGVGLAACLVAAIDPGSLVVALGLFALIGFHITLGWKLHRLGRPE
ncbi:MAG TPA: DUF4386 family protein [Actinokineospora sp.]|jgi:hypothetical protein|nr:DUF4386 family protein [Actinokineospora sp.]